MKTSHQTLSHWLVVSLLLTAPPVAAKMEIVRLSDTMIIAQEGRSRAFALNAARGIVVIDTHATLARMREAKELIEAEFKRSDYAYVINTHDHWEHIGGNGVFDRATIIVAHEGFHDGRKEDDSRLQAACGKIEQDLRREEELLAGLASDSPNFRNSSEKIAELRSHVETIRAGVAGPTIVFRDRLTLDLGDRTVKLIFYGKGHSHSDILVHIPEEKVLLTGGACSLSKLPPAFPAYAGTMDVARWITVLSELVDRDAELNYIVPGHAPHLARADLRFLRDYYQTLWSGLNQARQDGATLAQVKTQFALETQFGDWARLAQPTDDVILQHATNIEELWRFLGRAPAVAP